MWCGRTCSLRSNCGSSTKSKWTVLWRSLGPCCKTVCESTQKSQCNSVYKESFYVSFKSSSACFQFDGDVTVCSEAQNKTLYLLCVHDKDEQRVKIHIHCVVDISVPAIRYQARPQQDWREDGPQDHSGSTIPSLWQHSRHGLCSGDICASQVRLRVHSTVLEWDVGLLLFSCSPFNVSLFFSVSFSHFSDRQTRF